MSARTADVEGLEALAPWVHDLIAEAQALRDQAKALEARASVLEAELVEAANASPMGECPEWCSGASRFGDHGWRLFQDDHEGASFMRMHEGRKGNRNAEQFEIIRGRRGRELRPITGSRIPEHVAN